MENCTPLFPISTEVHRTRAPGPGLSRRMKVEAVEMTKYKSGTKVERARGGAGARKVPEKFTSALPMNP